MELAISDTTLKELQTFMITHDHNAKNESLKGSPLKDHSTESKIDGETSIITQLVIPSTTSTTKDNVGTSITIKEADNGKKETKDSSIPTKDVKAIKKKEVKDK